MFSSMVAVNIITCFSWGVCVKIFCTSVRMSAAGRGRQGTAGVRMEGNRQCERVASAAIGMSCGCGVCDVCLQHHIWQLQLDPAIQDSPCKDPGRWHTIHRYRGLS
jgi:hypothetical protein